MNSGRLERSGRDCLQTLLEDLNLIVVNQIEIGLLHRTVGKPPRLCRWLETNEGKFRASTEAPRTATMRSLAERQLSAESAQNRPVRNRPHFGHCPFVAFMATDGYTPHKASAFSEPARSFLMRKIDCRVRPVSAAMAEAPSPVFSIVTTLLNCARV